MMTTSNANPVVRRRLTTSELATWRALLDTTSELRRRLSDQLQETSLSPADYEVLLALTEASGRELRSSELASAIKWDRSRLSHHLGRMERRGLIRRDECLTDNRGAVIVLETDGSAAFRHASAPHLKAIQKHFADALSPEQFDALAEILAAVQNHLNLSSEANNG
jgi:DNA-binding MarR family transcriptional regulator